MEWYKFPNVRNRGHIYWIFIWYSDIVKRNDDTKGSAGGNTTGPFPSPIQGKKMFRIVMAILLLALLATDIMMLSIAWTHRPFSFREIIDSLRDLLRGRKDR